MYNENYQMILHNLSFLKSQVWKFYSEHLNKAQYFIPSSFQTTFNSLANPT